MYFRNTGRCHYTDSVTAMVWNYVMLFAENVYGLNLLRSLKYSIIEECSVNDQLSHTLL